jgi:hypothetical protein
MVYDLPERLDKRWNDQNYKRLLKVMMERKKVDRELLEKQTKILKDRMRYNEEKKVAIKENLLKIEEDLSSIRSRLIPVEEYQATREELVGENVDILLKKKIDYVTLENKALKLVNSADDMKPFSHYDVLKRIKANRDILNQSLGRGKQAKFEKFRNERQQSKMSRYSSMSQIARPRSVTFSAELKDTENNS